MRNLSGRALSFMGILTMLSGITASSAVPASAIEATPRRAPIIEVIVTPEGLAAPTRHTSGVTSFRVATTIVGDQGSTLGLVRLRPGTSPATFATHLGQVFSSDRAVAVPAARALMAEAELLGGAQVQPDQPATFTTTLSPGTYYLLDYVAFRTEPPAGPEVLHELTITGDRHSGLPPVPRAVVLSLSTPTGPAFLVPSRISAGQPLLFTNLMDQVNEAILQPVHAETTEADVQAFFEFLEGGPPAPDPFVGVFTGSPPISSGRSSVLQLTLPPGRYALITFVFDVDDGVFLAAKGMHRIVTVI